MDGTYFVTVQVTENGQPIEHEFNKSEVEVYRVGKEIKDSDLAKVKYSIGMKINIGNYQSANVDVGIELPADASLKENLEAVYEEARDFCNDKLMEEVAVLSELKKNNKGGK